MEEVAGVCLRFVLTASVIWVVAILLRLYKTVWKKSGELRRRLREQGIPGPPPSSLFMYGNLPEMQKIQLQAAKSSLPNQASDIIAHDYTSTLFPYFEKWRKEYGPLYTYSTGTRQHLYVNKVELVKELNLSLNLNLGKASYVTEKLAPMLGNSVVRANGSVWAQQRKIIAPEFFIDKVKGMVGLMMDSAQLLIKKWENEIDEAEDHHNTTADIRVDEDLRSFSADVISRACFGSSYSKGKEIFSKLRTLQKLISQEGSYLFGQSFFSDKYFKSKKKQERTRKLEKEIESLIWETVQKREQERSKTSSSSCSEKDLLQLLMEGAMNNDPPKAGGKCKESHKNFIVDNCKSIYFAGHESTAVSASWCLMLLALHPEWQAKIRTEVIKISPNGLAEEMDANSISQLKVVNMVIQEALRLYPPAAFVSREALEDTKLGNILVPKGVFLWSLIPTLHRDVENWGEDCNEFRPERFENGIGKACKFPQGGYIPFGAGPRLCLGKNFALVQLKLIISLLISKFHFSLSPKYRHSPSYRMIVEPAHGVNILIKRI